MSKGFRDRVVADRLAGACEPRLTAATELVSAAAPSTPAALRAGRVLARLRGWVATAPPLPAAGSTLFARCQALQRAFEASELHALGGSIAFEATDCPCGKATVEAPLSPGASLKVVFTANRLFVQSVHATFPSCSVSQVFDNHDKVPEDEDGEDFIINPPPPFDALSWVGMRLAAAEPQRLGGLKSAAGILADVLLLQGALQCALPDRPQVLRITSMGSLLLRCGLKKALEKAGIITPGACWTH